MLNTYSSSTIRCWTEIYPYNFANCRWALPKKVDTLKQLVLNLTILTFKNVQLWNIVNITSLYFLLITKTTNMLNESKAGYNYWFKRRQTHTFVIQTWIKFMTWLNLPRIINNIHILQNILPCRCSRPLQDVKFCSQSFLFLINRKNHLYFKAILRQYVIYSY